MVLTLIATIVSLAPSCDSGNIDKSDKKTFKNIYNKMRKVAHRNVTDAAPGIARLIEKYSTQ